MVKTHSFTPGICRHAGHWHSLTGTCCPMQDTFHSPGKLPPPGHLLSCRPLLTKLMFVSIPNSIARDFRLVAGGWPWWENSCVNAENWQVPKKKKNRASPAPHPESWIFWLFTAHHWVLLPRLMLLEFLVLQSSSEWYLTTSGLSLSPASSLCLQNTVFTLSSLFYHTLGGVEQVPKQ